MDCRVIGERSDAVLRTAMPGNNDVGKRSRDAIAPAQLSRIAMIGLQRGPFFLLPPKTEGSGAPNGAGGREPCPLPGPAASLCRAAHLSALHCGLRDFRPAPARASASWNHRMQTGGPSPAPVQQAPCSPITRRTGMMPRPPADKGDEPHPQNPRPLRQKPSPVDVPHEERADRR